VAVVVKDGIAENVSRAEARVPQVTTVVDAAACLVLV
jgi:hypothetical protein